MNTGEDPLDLFDDDNDGVIETILLFDDQDETKPAQARSGCVIPLILCGLATGGSVYGLISLFV